MSISPTVLNMSYRFVINQFISALGHIQIGMISVFGCIENMKNNLKLQKDQKRESESMVDINENMMVTVVRFTILKKNYKGVMGEALNIL